MVLADFCYTCPSGGWHIQRRKMKVGNTLSKGEYRGDLTTNHVTPVCCVCVCVPVFVCVCKFCALYSVCWCVQKCLYMHGVVIIYFQRLQPKYNVRPSNCILVDV